MLVRGKSVSIDLPHSINQNPRKIKRRFILPELTEKVVTVVRDSALSHSSASLIYDWGLTIGQQYEVSSKLSEDVVKYIFTSEILETQRIFAVSRILESENKEKFLEDITMLVRTGLMNYSKNQRFFNLKT